MSNLLQERVLVVGRPVDAIERHLSEMPHKVEWAPNARAAAMLLQHMKFQYLVVGYPLPDVEIREFLSELRRSDSASATARLLLVTHDDLLWEACTLRDEGLVAGVLSVECADTEVGERLARFMKTAPRVMVRMPVRARLLDGVQELVGQTVNLSESGVLISANETFAVGSEIEVALAPKRGHEIVGGAVVVRVASMERERIRGMGLLFTGFGGDGLLRLNVLIRGLLAEVVV